MKTIAALFVETAGVYFGLEGVEPWDSKRDARLYAGPHPVVAHPPCQRWGRYWHGGPSARVRSKKGDDGGCFIAALTAVRTWGGVLEHPEASAAWKAFGMVTPFRFGGWCHADLYGGFTACVEQGHYGHKARKATWLYVNKVDLRALIWGSSGKRLRLDQGFQTAELRAKAKKENRISPAKRLTPKENIATPIAFRDVLLSIARGVE